jgi:hypothetical protein
MALEVGTFEMDHLKQGKSGCPSRPACTRPAPALVAAFLVRAVVATPAQRVALVGIYIHRYDTIYHIILNNGGK